MGQNESFGSGNMGILPPLQDFIVSQSDIKLIALLRNPVDWAYAAWHFWCHPLFDGHDCTGWASMATNKTDRTPENFETLLKLHCVGKVECFAKGWGNWDTAARHLDGPQASRVVIIRSENLADDVGGTLERLWDFLGMPNKLRHPDILESLQYGPKQRHREQRCGRYGTWQELSSNDCRESGHSPHCLRLLEPPIVFCQQIPN